MCVGEFAAWVVERALRDGMVLRVAFALLTSASPNTNRDNIRTTRT